MKAHCFNEVRYYAILTSITTAYIIEPKSGWAKLWKALTDEGLLTLPDSSSLEGRAWVTDGIGYVVEFSSNGAYRTYLYSNPKYQKWPEAKQIIQIIKILSDEFDVKRLF